MVFLLVTSVFVLLLLFSSDIALLLVGASINRTNEVSNSILLEPEDRILFNIDKVIINDDMFHSVEVVGWAILPFSNDSGVKTVNLFLVSNEHSYEINTAIVERIELRSFFQEHNVDGMQHGFVSTFSPVKIKKGEYKLYLFYKNDTSESLIDTGMLLQKEGKDLRDINLD